MGLATVYGIIKQSGGFVNVFSEIGKGTCFEIYLPCFVEDAVTDSKKTFTEDRLHGDEIILLVEDEEIVRKLTRKILESYGYKVIEAKNGENALEVLNIYNGKIDLLLTDVVMPKLGGAGLFEKLTNKIPNLKVLFTSGYTENSRLNLHLIDGNINFIQKPFTHHSLAVKIRQILNSNNLPQ